MITVVYLSGQEVSVLVGTENKRQMTVKRAVCAAVPENSMVNGFVTNEKVFGEFIRNFWEANRLPKRKVILIPGNAPVLEKTVQIPVMSRREMYEYLPREFASAGRPGNMALSYAVLGENGIMRKVLAVMADHAMIEAHAQRFRDAGIRLAGIVPESACALLLLNCLPFLRRRTFVVQILKGVNLFNILYVDGTFFQMNRIRIFEAGGTAEFGLECARAVLSFQQFLGAKKKSGRITHVYLAGDFSEEDLEMCREAASRMDPALKTVLLSYEDSGTICFESGEDIAGRSPVLLGGLLACRQRSAGFRYRCHRDPLRLEKRRKLAGTLLPAAAFFLACGLIPAGQSVLRQYLTERAEKLEKLAEDPSAVLAAAEYDRLEQECGERRERALQIRNAADYLDSCPVYTSEIKNIVESCGEGLANVQVAGYDGRNAAVEIHVFASGAGNISRFAERLMEHEDIVADLAYEGFEFREGRNLWEAAITVILKKPGAEQMPEEKETGYENDKER